LRTQHNQAKEVIEWASEELARAKLYKAWCWSISDAGPTREDTGGAKHAVGHYESTRPLLSYAIGWWKEVGGHSERYPQPLWELCARSRQGLHLQRTQNTPSAVSGYRPSSSSHVLWRWRPSYCYGES
jgi:hypothetical protein